MSIGSRQRVAVVVLAAGSGSRFRQPASGASKTRGVVNKAYLPLDGVPMVGWSLRRAAELDGLTALVLVVAEPDRERAASIVTELGLEPTVEIVTGGATRHASEWAALGALDTRISGGLIDIVVIHDGARPYAEPTLFTEVIAQAAEHGGAIPGRVQPGVIAVDPADDLAGDLVTVQTPQAFRALELVAAYARAHTDGFDGTDTAGTIERYAPPDVEIVVVDGPASNVKITYASDV